MIWITLGEDYSKFRFVLLDLEKLSIKQVAGSFVQSEAKPLVKGLGLLESLQDPSILISLANFIDLPVVELEYSLKQIFENKEKLLQLRSIVQIDKSDEWFERIPSGLL